MDGGVRLFGGGSSGRAYHNFFPEYPIDRKVIFSNVVTRKVIIGLKEVGDAQLVGYNWKGCIWAYAGPSDLHVHEGLGRQDHRVREDRKVLHRPISIPYNYIQQVEHHQHL